MMDAFLERIHSPLTWAFVLGVLALMALNRIAAKVAEISTNLNEIRKQQYELTQKIEVLAEVVNNIESQLSTIETVAQDVETYILPDPQTRADIYRIRNSPP